MAQPELSSSEVFFVHQNFQDNWHCVLPRCLPFALSLFLRSFVPSPLQSQCLMVKITAHMVVSICCAAKATACCGCFPFSLYIYTQILSLYHHQLKKKSDGRLLSLRVCTIYFSSQIPIVPLFASVPGFLLFLFMVVVCYHLGRCCF